MKEAHFFSEAQKNKIERVQKEIEKVETALNDALTPNSPNFEKILNLFGKNA